jgi:hypothetical protein
VNFFGHTLRRHRPRKSHHAHPARIGRSICLWLMPWCAVALLGESCQRGRQSEFPAPTNTPGQLVRTGDARYDFAVAQSKDVCRSTALLTMVVHGAAGRYRYSVLKSDGHVKGTRFVGLDGASVPFLDTDSSAQLRVDMDTPNATGDVWLRARHDLSGDEQNVAFAVAAPTSTEGCEDASPSPQPN